MYRLKENNNNLKQAGHAYQVSLLKHIGGWSVDILSGNVLCMALKAEKGQLKPLQLKHMVIILLFKAINIVLSTNSKRSYLFKKCQNHFSDRRGANFSLKITLFFKRCIMTRPITMIIFTKTGTKPSNVCSYNPNGTG